MRLSVCEIYLREGIVFWNSVFSVKRVSSDVAVEEEEPSFFSISSFFLFSCFISSSVSPETAKITEEESSERVQFLLRQKEANSESERDFRTRNCFTEEEEREE